VTEEADGAGAVAMHEEEEVVGRVRLKVSWLPKGS